jgi:3-carboxy-cis,cis-muconate cycloisomerase
VELAGWLAMVSGSLAKMAQDIILLAQTEVAEVRESGDDSRGGSSTIPQKNNPIISEQIIAAARTNAALLPAMQQAAIQEHERGTHGWQMEWLTLPQMVGFTAVSLNKALFLSNNLVVNKVQMQQNIANSHGLMLAEAISFALTEQVGRAEAKHIVEEACQIAWTEKRHLLDVVKEMVGVEKNTAVNWETLPDEAHYLGETETFIDQVLQAMTNPIKLIG